MFDRVSIRFGSHRVAWLLIAFSTAACRSTQAAPAVAADSCERWLAEVCRRTGGKSETCETIQLSIELLTPDACAVALAAPAFLDERMKVHARACQDLRDRLCSDLGARTRSCKTAREQSKSFTPERCLKMLGGYAQTRSQLAAQNDAYRVSKEVATRLASGDAPSRGPSQAKLQLVAFVDFENRFCAQGAAVWRELEAQYGEQLRVVVRMFPLPDNPHARLAAEAALAAHAQGKFWEMHDLLLANQTKLERPALEHYASQLHLDLRAFKTALDRHTYAPAIDADLAIAKELSLVAMPTVYLNGERMLNGVDRELLVDAADEFLAASEIVN
jgi:protein-disulfide isomerase